MKIKSVRSEEHKTELQSGGHLVCRGVRCPSVHDALPCLEGIHSTDTFLNQDRIIDIALTSGADAIHPGYGFLSENGAFVRKIEEKDLIFIGPSAHSIDENQIF